jgi:glucose/arabinose dehydrogenase
MHRLIALLLAALAWGTSQAQTLKPVPVATGLDSPWALAFLPDGRLLVTERPGQMRIVAADGRVGPALGGLPPVDAGGQCGLLDVVVDPEFAKNGLIFWTFAEAGDGGNSTAVARGRLAGDRLLEVRTIFSQKPKVASRNHCGSRIVFGRDGTLWVGLGDRYSRKDDAQNPANHLGKVIRIDRDGRAPADNPKFAAAEVWSLGHRNIQGAAAHPATGALWTVEHGPQGGDEVNTPQRGMNYGWPLVTRGRNYVTGTRIGEDGPRPGYEEAMKVWVPSIAPSGMAFLSSDRYPGWQGSLFVGALKAQTLVRLTLDGGKMTGEERLLQDLGERIRDVRQGPDGWLYVLTDGRDGRVLRLER